MTDAARVALVVDDYPAGLAWIARAFTRAGWTVLTATDDHEARTLSMAQRAHGAPISLLVTETEVPGGRDVARALRDDDPQLTCLLVHPPDALDPAWRADLGARGTTVAKPVLGATLVAVAESMLATARD